MDANRFSSKLKKYNEQNASKRIKEDIKLLKEHFKDGNVKLYEWVDNKTIIVTLELKVNFPSRGAVNGIAIQPAEPIMILIEKDSYPYKAPSVFSDRRDFPSSTLPHLNPVPKGFPANFCLHRGNINDWFAEHSIIDLVERTESWLNDAVADKLIRGNDEFEFTRIIKSRGFIVYSEQVLLNLLQINYKITGQKKGYDFLCYELLRNSKEEPLIKKDAFAVKLVNSAFKKDEDSLGETLKNLKQFNVWADDHSRFSKHLFGILAFADSDIIHKDYFGEIPDKLKGFKEWAESFGIPLKAAIEDYFKKDLHIISGIPVSIVFRRPQKLINHSSEIEIINFLIFGTKEYVADTVPSDETPVHFLDHRHPLTLKQSRDLSSFDTTKQVGEILQIGMGALGSKIALHIGRSGIDKMTLVDNDELSPHNLTRHSLFANSLGKNKAEALKKEMESFYPSKQSTYSFESESIVDLVFKNPNYIKKYKFIIDTSASNSLFSYFTELDALSKQKLIRAELTNNGELGILYIEGKNRNPRIDDIQMMIFDSSLENALISNWLKKNQTYQVNFNPLKEEIMVGLSCSSDTLKIADDIISFHASVQSAKIKNTFLSENSNGMALLTVAELSQYENKFSTKQIAVDSFDIIKFKNTSDWELRIKKGVKEQMFELLQKDYPNETGGLLIGRINSKRKTVHVTRILTAPDDSVKQPYFFIRGRKGVPLKIRKINKQSGGILNYVGEWHTHPKGGSQMSGTDLEAVEKLREFLDPINYPVFILIVTPTKIHPYIYGAKK